MIKKERVAQMDLAIRQLAEQLPEGVKASYDYDDDPDFETIHITKSGRTLHLPVTGNGPDEAKKRVIEWANLI